MNKKQILTYGAIAALTVILPKTNAADAQVSGHVDLPKTEVRTDTRSDSDVRVHTDRLDRDRDVDRNAKIGHSDKASGILGMEVRNNENQKLGEIKDLVMDINSGRVDYAVLAVGGFLGIGEKLIALPPRALKVSAQGDYLVLDADKSRIQAAPGFAATAWPSRHDPEINQFWSEIKATGSPASSEINRRHSETDLNLDRDHSVKSEVHVNTDGTRKKIYTDSDKKE